MGCVYFVRHGQTIWNVENKICGATDIALTKTGHEQAIETGKKILEEGIQADEILYSPLIRARGYSTSYFGDHRDSGKRRTTADGAEFWKLRIHTKRWKRFLAGQSAVCDPISWWRIYASPGTADL